MAHCEGLKGVQSTRHLWRKRFVFKIPSQWSKATRISSDVFLTFSGLRPCWRSLIISRTHIPVSILFIVYNTPTETTPCAVSKLATGTPPNTNGENYNTAILISAPDAPRLIRHMWLIKISSLRTVALSRNEPRAHGLLRLTCSLPLTSPFHSASFTIDFMYFEAKAPKHFINLWHVFRGLMLTGDRPGGFAFCLALPGQGHYQHEKQFDWLSALEV